MLRSMPVRLALGLVLLFAVVIAAGPARELCVMHKPRSTQTMRADLTQDMAGFRAAPSASALAALVDGRGAQ